jgi:nitrite reductase/ring-hydroxylating ferredoxin subunit
LSGTSLRRVGKAAEVAEGEIRPVSVDGIEMILYRWRGRFFAAQRRCLHQGADLAEGLLSRGSIICAQHGWRFDAETGVHEMSAENCLVTYRVHVEGEDLLVDPTPVRRAAVPQ